MKWIIRHIFIDAASLYITSLTAQGMVFEKGLYTFIYATLILVAVSLFAKPVINMLLLPLNLVTFGVFRWISSAIALYIVTILSPGFKIVAFNFVGLTSKWVDIPQINVTGVLAYIFFALVLSILSTLIHWVLK